MTAPTAAASVAALVSIVLAMVLAVLGDPVLQNASTRATLPAAVNTHQIPLDLLDGDEDEDPRSAVASKPVIKVDKSTSKVSKYVSTSEDPEEQEDYIVDQVVKVEKEQEEEEDSTFYGESWTSELPHLDSTYIASNCSSCRARAEVRELSLQNIKDQILSKLGMSLPPNITGRIPVTSIPPLHDLLDQYGMQSDSPGHTQLEENDDFHAMTKKVIAFAQPLHKLRHWNGKYTLYFHFSQKITRNRVMKATMWIYMKRLPALETEKIVSGPHLEKTLTVEMLPWLRSNAGDSPVIFQFHPYKEVAKEGWVKVPATKLLQRWFSEPNNNLGVVINATDSRGRFAPILDASNEEDKDFMPFVEVVVEDSRKHRIKRNIGLVCNEKSQETRCCRYPLTVDFEEFGWDWIIAPKKYEANYCSGECPYVFLQKYPHTHIVQQANPAGTAGPCCAPRKMSPISMLYFDNEFNIILGVLPGMVVDRCGCS